MAEGSKQGRAPGRASSAFVEGCRRGGRTTSATSPVRGIGQIAINTRGVPRAVAFYRDALGLDLLFEAGPLAFFGCGDVRLMLSTAETAEHDHRSSLVYFGVDGIRAARSALAERGVPFEDEPHLVARMPDHELWMTFFRDRIETCTLS
jgi:catechol 2,3-dioxygenase-like lactoylglutathione lyase family enzyme